MIMGVISWIVLGLIAGFIASTLMNNRHDGLPFNMLLGLVGAVLGGWLFNAIGASGVTGFNVWSLLVAVAGSVVLLMIWHTMRRSIHHA